MTKASATVGEESVEMVDEPEDPVPHSHGSVQALALGVAHALNNPLAGLIASLDLAAAALKDARREGRDRTPEILEMLAEAKTAAERVHSVVVSLGATAGVTPTSASGSAPPQARAPVQKKSRSTARPRSGPSAPPKKARVLVVDDEPIVGTALRRALREFDVVVLEDGRQALERLIAGERFDAVLCDLMMPGMTGMDLHEEILRIAPEQARAMVFLTGGAVTTRARDFVADTRNTVLEKPFDVRKIRELIRSRMQ